MESYFASNYFAPEVLAGKPKNFKNDSWGLGIVLYMLCMNGNNPFFENYTRDEVKLDLVK